MTDITELTSVQKNANIHRLSRLIAYAPNDELRQMAVEVEHYTDQLIEALEKAQQVDEELCRLLPPGAEYMDPPDGGDVTPLEGVRRMVADYRQRIAELECQLKSAENNEIDARCHIAELESRTVTAPQSDYFASLVALARVSADKAMKKFPQPNYVLLKVAEEAGEVV